MRYILTGGIASGKSTVVSILKSKGIDVIDADEISHQIFSQNQDQIREMFGLSSTDTQLRKDVGKIVFKESTKREELETLLHPLIKTEIQNQEKLMNGKQYILDIPLYFEIRAKKEDGDYVVLVLTSKENQIERILERDGLTPQEALDRINSQLDNGKKALMSDYILRNMSTYDELRRNVYGMIDTLFGL
jgi:dephospho-CoA kinase